MIERWYLPLPLGAQSPYGAARVGPDTYINIFSHTHVLGAGIVDYGEVGIFPVQVDNEEELQQMIAKKHGYRSAFKHESEQVQPGFYQLYLDTHNIQVELTATEQVGVHRYTFDDFKTNRLILIDSSYALPPSPDGCKQSHVNLDPSKNEITGLKGFFPVPSAV